MIGDAKCEESIHYLHDSDDEAAEAKVEVRKTEDEVDAIQAAIFNRVEGSVEARKAIAKTHEESVRARNAYYVALLKYERLFNKRKTAERIIELWRTVSSNKRAGQV